MSALPVSCVWLGGSKREVATTWLGLKVMSCSAFLVASLRTCLVSILPPTQDKTSTVAPATPIKNAVCACISAVNTHGFHGFHRMLVFLLFSTFRPITLLLQTDTDQVKIGPLSSQAKKKNKNKKKTGQGLHHYFQD